ncbi:hypothetical protein PROP_03121 [Propionicimonas sp. T2.31MG-18]
MTSTRGLIARSVLAGACSVLALTCLAGCVNFAEDSLDTVVYFDNKTDRTLWVRLKTAPGVRYEYLRIDPLKTTQLRLVDRGECTSGLLITDIDGATVKDPGRLCWHGTVTIP